MKTQTLSRTTLTVSFALAFALGLLGCGTKGKTEATSDIQTSTIVPIQVATVQRQEFAVVKTYSGPLEGEDQANIIARVSERITSVKVHVGDAVRVGKAIILLDKSGASSQYFQAEANFKNAEKTLGRMRSLYSEGAISQQSLDGAQTAYDVARANFDAARSSIELTTPIAGTVTAVNVTEGDLTIPGSTLATVATVGRMKVIFNISETDVTNFHLGQKVQVYSETRPDARVEGKITQLSKSADPRSRSFEVKALFQNSSDRWFKPGMFCKVDVQISPREKVLVIPNAAVQSDGMTNLVFVVHAGRSFKRTVLAGITDGRNIVILQGLDDGDTVATIGMNNLKDSSVVNISGME